MLQLMYAPNSAAFASDTFIQELSFIRNSHSPGPPAFCLVTTPLATLFPSISLYHLSDSYLHPELPGSFVISFSENPPPPHNTHTHGEALGKRRRHGLIKVPRGHARCASDLLPPLSRKLIRSIVITLSHCCWTWLKCFCSPRAHVPLYQRSGALFPSRGLSFPTWGGRGGARAPLLRYPPPPPPAAPQPGPVRPAPPRGRLRPRARPAQLRCYTDSGPPVLFRRTRLSSPVPALGRAPGLPQAYPRSWTPDAAPGVVALLPGARRAPPCSRPCGTRKGGPVSSRSGEKSTSGGQDARVGARAGSLPGSRRLVSLGRWVGRARPGAGWPRR